MKTRQTLAALESTRPAQHDAELPRAAGMARIDVAAHLVRRVGGALPLGRLALLVLASCVCGGAMSWASGWNRAGVLSTVADVEKLVPVQVVGVIASDDPAKIANRRATIHRWSQIATTACEVFLALFLFGVLLVALLESPITNDFLNDPFGALAESIGRLFPH